MNKLLLVSSLCLSFPLAACTDIQSADVKTAGMSATMSVTADGTGASTARAQINVDTSGTDFVALSSGDQLIASVASQSETMSESDVLDDVSYAATFTGESGSGLGYTIDFERTTDTSAPNSKCTMPDPFTISAPIAGGTFSRGSSIAVSYGSAGTADVMAYSVSGACVNIASTAIGGDPGTFALAKGSIPATGSGGSCLATLTITRSRQGSLDPAFGSGGQIQCAQSRQVTFTSTP